MPKSSPKKLRKVTKGANRRREGYELTRQRDMLPVALGAAAAALAVHIIAYLIAPSIFNYTLRSADDFADSVKDETKRVYFKVKKEENDLIEEEIEEKTGPEPEPIVAQELEPQDVDLLDTELTELEMRPGDTQLFIKSDIPIKADLIQTPDAQPTAEVSTEVLPIMDTVPDPQLIESADPVPLNANDTVINLAPQNSTAEHQGDTLEADLKESAREGAEYLPPDTRSLTELLGQTTLSSQSGVARLGSDLLFDFNECKLKNSALVSLQQLAALIQINTTTHFIIEGHSDSIGRDTYNAFISLQRAAAVRQWLRDIGVPTERVYIRACANNSPLVPTTGKSDEEKLNRRVEIHMRSADEAIPEGCLKDSYHIPLNKKVTHLLEAKVPTPKTYKSVSRLLDAGQFADDDDAQPLENTAPGT